MRTFKIIDHSLQHWQWAYDYNAEIYIEREIVHGMKVCAVAKLETMGIITHIGEKTGFWKGYRNQPDKYYVEIVTVLWLTGPRKGTTQVKDTKTLANYDSYRSAVLAHVAELDAIEAEAAKTGM